MVKRAREILKDIEDGGVQRTVVREAEPEFDLFTGITMSKDNEAADRIRNLDLNTTTPIEAMNLLFELKQLLSD